MLFNSVNFIIFFLVVYSLYIILNHKPQNILLLFSSYIFYGWWDWRFLLLIFITTLTDYFCAQWVYKLQSNFKDAKRYLILSIIINLGILGIFKYFNFFTDSAVRFLNILGFNVDTLTIHVILPVGISFYTFQSMSYTIDVYRKKIQPVRHFMEYALYVSFFPQLVAGPIERAVNLIPQIQKNRVIKYYNIRVGAWLILFGYFKKIVVADNLADIANAVFNNPSGYHGLSVLMGIYAFAFQIYGDFSGYSDIARGLAMVMGFDIIQNFRMPYFAKNPQEFWKRWHISLSNWLRDYLYIPIGGNRKDVVTTYRNIIVTMLIGGLWHGAAWNFVIWGGYHGILLIMYRLAVEKTNLEDVISYNKKLIKVLLMFHFTCFGWVLFRINKINDFYILTKNLFVLDTMPIVWIVTILILIGPLLFLDYLQDSKADILIIKKQAKPVRILIYCSLIAYITFLSNVNSNEFIYFQF